VKPIEIFFVVSKLYCLSGVGRTKFLRIFDNNINGLMIKWESGLQFKIKIYAIVFDCALKFSSIKK